MLLHVVEAHDVLAHALLGLQGVFHGVPSFGWGVADGP